MGTNLHTAYSEVAPKTKFTAASMGAPLSELDKAISLIKNLSISCDGIISYNKNTGILSWSNSLRINFTTAAGLSVYNTVNAGNVTISDNYIAYVDLNETTGTVISVSTATVPSGAASPFVTVDRVVLGYRDSTSDDYYPVHLHNVISTFSTIRGSTGGLTKKIAESTGTPAGTTTYFVSLSMSRLIVDY